MLITGKRYLVAGDAKSGKSIALAVVQALAIVEAGGRVVIIDRENGADEMARRLRDVLADRDPQLRAEWQQRAHYYAWPALTEGDGPALAAALAGTDLVIFDSSRIVTAALGLAEDSSDDYARFIAALVQPLFHAGIATLILDNAGHEEKQRPRGSSAKADLNEVVFSLRTIREFDRRTTGEIELRRTHTRFPEVEPLWRMRIGGGTYEPFALTRALPDPVETASSMTPHLTVLPALPDAEEAKRQAWTIIMGAAEEALTIPGLPEETRSRLARIHRAAGRAAARPILRFAEDGGAA